MGELFEVIGFLLSPLMVLTIVLVGVTAMSRATQTQQSRDGVRPTPRKVTSSPDRASQLIRRTEARMERLDVQHEREDCTFSYSTQDPNFSFNGRQVVDELAELRRRNEAHERHLLARVHRD